MANGPEHLTGRAILVIEDEPLIALDIADCLQQAGANVFTASTLRDGIRLAEHSDLAAAIVDFSLGSDDATPLCERLSPNVGSRSCSTADGHAI
jgi:DNA-binding response OmpR family regulator